MKHTRIIVVACLLAVTVLGQAAICAEQPKPIKILARDPAGHGLLCQSQGKTILLVSGTPRQMGAAHGTLLKKKARLLVERVLYVVGGADSVQSGKWFLDRMGEIQRRTLPHIPKRFLDDGNGNVAGVETRDFQRTREQSPSRQDYHWMRNWETYYLIGKGMGDAMTGLVSDKPAR